MNRTIHQTWRTSEVPDPPFRRKWQDSWRILNPGWNYVLWTDYDIDKYIRDFHPDFYEIWCRYPVGIMKVDSWRYLLLKEQGGLYVDLDFACLAPLDEWLPSKFAVGDQGDGLLCNAFMWAPVPAKELFDKLQEQLSMSSNISNIVYSTGPGFLTRYLTGRNSQIDILPTQDIYPVPYWDRARLEEFGSLDTAELKRRFPRANAMTFWTHSWKEQSTLLEKNSARALGGGQIYASSGGDARGGQVRKITDVIMAEDSGGEWIPAMEGFRDFPMDLSRVRGDRSKFNPFIKFNEFVPESGVLVLEGGGTLGKDGWTLTSKGQLVINMGWQRAKGERELAPEYWPSIRSYRKISGVCLDLCSNGCADNYAHWLLEAIGRLAVLDYAGIDHRNFDWIRIPKGAFIQGAHIMKTMGLDERKFVVPSQPDTLLQFDTLVKPSIAGVPKQFHSYLIEFLRNKIGIQNGDGPDKVFLRRSSSMRKLLNGRALEEMLKDRGFSVIDPSIDPFGAHASARVLIGAHQAGLADIIFTAPGMRMLELLPTDQQSPYFYSVGKLAGHDYECLLCDSERVRLNARGVSPYNFVANIEEVEGYVMSVS